MFLTSELNSPNIAPPNIFFPVEIFSTLGEPQVGQCGTLLCYFDLEIIYSSIKIISFFQSSIAVEKSLLYCSFRKNINPCRYHRNRTIIAHIENNFRKEISFMPVFNLSLRDIIFSCYFIICN